MPQGLLHLVTAARPNFMKIAPLYHRLRTEPWCRAAVVHTGQHYDPTMSEAFFKDLELPDPDHHLGVGSGSHAEQTAKVMIAYERLCQEARPDWTIVVGDVNSTMACTLVAAKLGIKVAHLEAGLRSRDRSMPEEINRIVTDTLADLLWTPSPDADANLLAEGVSKRRIDRVGNIMLDSYEFLRARIEACHSRDRFALGANQYGVVTLHRPSNVDEQSTLQLLMTELCNIAAEIPLIFPVHPRTRERLRSFGFDQMVEQSAGLITTAPMGYIEFMSLVSEAAFIITDSGGVQEETTYLSIPCVTLRTTTERPITITDGTNQLVQPTELHAAVQKILAGSSRKGSIPALWDGHTATRVVNSLKNHWK